MAPKNAQIESMNRVDVPVTNSSKASRIGSRPEVFTPSLSFQSHADLRSRMRALSRPHHLQTLSSLA
ncbi:MAG: hypothetical protein FJY38_00965 [Betaproteobacteria bacterium]|nr:hypothetical protein [Betaproteobacteria bacterium]